ncbi:MAG: MFS transporter [Proteobacteria bacterium]|nr:MFS transporter [Pseudomonadota bacterium]MBU1737273.1 MFS transporter [Pseudomonadota bacterium]
MTDYSKKWLRFIIVATGVFMSTLDSSMVNIALPFIMKDFQSPMATTGWVVLIYLLTITSTLLFWGHLANKYGRSMIYGIGMLIFGIASWACALSTSLASLIVFRCLQAQGASMMMAIGPAIVKESFPPEQLGRALGLIGVAVSLGLMSGPSLGGIFIEYFSWRALFYITVPVGILFAILARRMLPANHSHAADETIDWIGAITLAGSLCAFTYTMTRTAERGLTPVTLSLLLVLAAVLLLIFIRTEHRSANPVLPLYLFKDRFFSFGILSAVLSFTTLFTAIMLIPFYLDRLLELPPVKIGLVMMIIPASIMIVAPFSGWLSDKVERRFVASAGLLIGSCAMASLTGITAESGWLDISWKLALLGGGQAMFLSPNSAAVLSGTNGRFTGTAAALLATSRNLGMLLGVALATLVFTVVFGKLTGGLDMKDSSALHRAEFITAIRSAFVMAATIGTAGMIFSFCRGRKTVEK